MCATMCSECVELWAARVDVHRTVRVNLFGVHHVFISLQISSFLCCIIYFLAKIKMSFKGGWCDFWLWIRDLFHYTLSLHHKRKKGFGEGHTEHKHVYHSVITNLARIKSAVGTSREISEWWIILHHNCSQITSQCVIWKNMILHISNIYIYTYTHMYHGMYTVGLQSSGQQNSSFSLSLMIHLLSRNTA